MTDQLKPCPFCNGPACKIVANAFPPYGAAPLSDSYGDDGLDVDAYVYCHECGARGPEVEETIFNAAEYAEAEESAVRRWNISHLRSEIERQGELIELYQDQFEELHVARIMLSKLSAAGFSMGDDLIDRIVAMRIEAESLQAKLKRIEVIAECGSVQSWLALPDEAKAQWFGLYLEHDSERLKLRAENERLKQESPGECPCREVREVRVNPSASEIEALRKDAERYRFVRELAWYVDQAAYVYEVGNSRSPWSSERSSVDADDVEKSIDAAMERSQ